MTRQQLKDIAALGSRKSRRQQGRFLVEGVRSVEAAVIAGAPLALILVSHEASAVPRIVNVIAQARKRQIETHTLSATDLARIGDARTSQGVVAVSDSIVQAEPLAGASRVLVLDGVQDPGNVGALVRTAAWFGVGAVLADTNTADFESPKAVRAAMGGLWDLSLSRVEDLGSALDALLAEGVALWGARVGDDTSVPLAKWAPGERSALVMGSEAHGLSEASRQRLTGGVWIPGGGSGVESLNVAVAAGVLMHCWAEAADV